MATEAAAAKVAAMGLPKLNSYPHSKGGRGGSRGASPHGNRGGRPGVGGAPAPGMKPQRRRTLERKLARAKGTNRMVDRESGSMMGRAAALANAKTKLHHRLAAEGGAAVAPRSAEELGSKPALLPLKKKQKMAAAPVKKAQLLPSTDGSSSGAAVLPDFLRALGVGPGARDANGEAAWDLDEEMRYYEQQLGIRKAKKKKAAAAAAAKAAAAASGDESDDAELDHGAMSKLRQELAEDGLGDLFDFCELLESGGTADGDEEEEGFESFDRNDPDNRSDDDEEADDANAAPKSKSKSKESSDSIGGYSLARQKEILAREAAIDAKQDEIEAALKKAMEKEERKKAASASKVARANALQAKADRGEDVDEEAEDDEEGMDEDEEDEGEDGDAVPSRKRRRDADEDEEEGEDEDGEDDEQDEEDAEMADGDNADEAEAEADAPRKKPSVADLYGFNAPMPDSLLAFRRGDKNILAGGAGASTSAAADPAGAAAAPAAPAKYVPPHLRAQLAAAAAAAAPAASPAAAAAAAVGVSSASTAAGLAALRRQLKGLLNRLTSANIEHIALQMTSTLYAQHSKREVTELLCDALLDLCTLQADGTSGGYALGSNSSTLLASAALVVFLHATVGQDIGAHFLEKFVLAFRDYAERAATLGASKGPGAGAAAAAALKSCTTLVTFLTYLYNFELVGSRLVYELVRKFVDEFRPDSIEMLLVVLANCGYQLRKDDPSSLKEIILLIQSKAKIYNATHKAAAGAAGAGAAAQPSSSSSSAAAGLADPMPEGRVAFMLDMIYDLKNNKKRHTSLYDSIQPLNNWLQGKLKRSKRADSASGNDMQLRFGYDDICNIPSRGRWWLVGSAWKGKRMGEPEEATADAGTNSKSKSGGGADPKTTKVHLPAEESGENVDLLSLARAQHMNTDLRRSLFLVVMSAVDYMDAYEKLCKLNLPPAQLRQVVKVLLDCAAHEAVYNPYYAFVLLQLSRMDGGKEIKFTTQLALWDLVKEWDEAEQTAQMRKGGHHRTEAARAAFQTKQQRQVINIAKLVALLLREPTTGNSGGAVPAGASAGSSGGGAGGGLGLQALKAFDFHALSPLQLLFLTAALKDFLLMADLPHVQGSMLRLHTQMNDKKAAAVPGRVAELRALRDGLDFFLQHHLAPTAAGLKNQEHAKTLKQRIGLARKALQGNVDSNWMFQK